MTHEHELIKVCLCNQGEDVESPWAYDLGPAGPDGSRKVRLVNVPFLHAKPTWGDVIVVTPDEHGVLTWDARGVPAERIGPRIAADGGRFAMIIDYQPRGEDPGGEKAYTALREACETSEDLEQSPIVCEGAFGPRDGEAGRVYLAVRQELRPEEIMTHLRACNLPCELELIHPEPVEAEAAPVEDEDVEREAPPVARPGEAKAKAAAAAKPAPAKKQPAAAKKPAAKQPAAQKAAAKRPAVKKAAAKKPAVKKAAAKKPAAKKPAKKAAAKKPAVKKAAAAKKPARKPAKKAAGRARSSR